jgi:hypothetical protein
LADLEREQQRVTAELDREWPARALELAPGALVLERACAALGSRFSKDDGDSVKVADLLDKTHVAPESVAFLPEVSEPAA